MVASSVMAGRLLEIPFPFCSMKLDQVALLFHYSIGMLARKKRTIALSLTETCLHGAIYIVSKMTKEKRQAWEYNHSTYLGYVGIFRTLSFEQLIIPILPIFPIMHSIYLRKVFIPSPYFVPVIPTACRISSTLNPTPPGTTSRQVSSGIVEVLGRREKLGEGVDLCHLKSSILFQRFVWSCCWVWGCGWLGVDGSGVAVDEFSVSVIVVEFEGSGVES
jgi:hypothetical protein